jgi:N-acetyl-gamma-glutamyl-phosphate reductase
MVASGFIEGTPIVDSKSGVSGAGRSKTDTFYTFSELSGGFQAYGVVGHRHTPEIEQTVGCKVRFVPHLVPMARGIHTTIHVQLKPGISRGQILELWGGTYRGRPFVHVQHKGWPSTKQVLGSNRCDLAADVDERTGLATLVSVIDNMVKGAAGQAIQNMNVMAGLPEETGLPLNGVWP